MRRFTLLVLAASAALPIHVTPAASDPARELIVVLAPAPPSGRAAPPARLDARCAALGLRIVRRLDDGLPAAAPAAPRSAADPFDLDPARVMLVEAADAGGARAALAALAADPAVAWVEPNATRSPAVEWIGSRGVARPQPFGPGSEFPNDPLFQDSRQWGLRNLGPAGAYGGVAGADIHALQAWATSTGANSVRLAVADTGIDPDQPDLAATMPDGGPRIADGFNATTGPELSFLDRRGHGTPVAGVMAALTNDGVHFDSLGMAGVCGGDGRGNLGCRIVPIKIVRDESGEATVFDIARAIHYATRLGCRALNLSFAGDAPSAVERAALRHAMTRNCVVVTAIGNKGYLFGDLPQYPAAYARDGLCVAVGATDPLDRRVIWSSYGPGLDVMAPGVDIWTTYMTYPSMGGVSYPGYVPAAGTSFAAPFVTGTIGLLAGARPDLAGSDLQPLLRASAHDIGAPGVDRETGWGRLDAAAALALISPETGFWRDEIAGTTFVPLGLDSVRVDGDAPPAALAFRGWRLVERVAVTAEIAIPDSFENGFEVWPRTGGTSTLRGDAGPLAFTPWCEVIAREGRRVTLRGYLFRVADAHGAPPEDAWLPVAPDQARFGFTAYGRVRRSVVEPAPARVTARIAAAPNPFRGATRITGPAGLRLAILDVRGRVVRRAMLDAAGRFVWDGRDGTGRDAPPGLYFARGEARAAGLRARVVRIE